MATILVLAAHGAHAQTKQPGVPMHDTGAAVTAVQGESWLNHLNRSFGETSMGKTGHLGPPALAATEDTGRWHPESSSSPRTHAVTVQGSDLYRLNCQGCHGESGQGAPPEINSVINPVRATSVALVMERMRTAGMEMSRADAAKLAQQSNAALLQRLHDGGQDMPPFPHLNEAEIRSLFAYLKQLAVIPGAEHEQMAVRESPIRIGEHIVKSTCHTCHSAAGPDPTPQDLWDGAIPPLSTLTARRNQSEFIQKVTSGAPILMGTPAMFYRGRMPVFYYLSQEEAADVYSYLTLYPPGESNSDTAIVLSQQASAGGGGTPPPQRAGVASFVSDQRPPEPQPSQRTDLHVILLSAVGMFVVVLLAGGLGFTMREFKRLSADGQNRLLAVKAKPRRRSEDATAAFQRAS